MKNGMKLLACAAMALSFAGCSDKGGGASVGIIQYAEHPALDNAHEGFVEGLKENGYDAEDGTVTIDYKNAQGDQSNNKTIANTFVNNNVDLIYAVATPAAQASANETKDIPIVISAVTDPATSGLVKSNDKPDTNVTGTSDLTPVDAQLDLLKQLCQTRRQSRSCTATRKTIRRSRRIWRRKKRKSLVWTSWKRP